MFKIIKYTIYDLIRSKWSYIYLAFYFLLGFVLLFLNNDLSKAVITLMNVIIILTPLIGTIFGIMHYYTSREFTELLLSQPIKRSFIFMAQYLGLSISLSLSLILGLSVPFLIYGVTQISALGDFFLLMVIGAMLTFIFVALSYNIALSNENRIKGFGYAIIIWLLFAIIYDGLFLISLLLFNDYPLDKLSIVATILNPIDLSRIIIMLRLDISALLGYTGAIFQKYFNNDLGVILSFFSLSLWIFLLSIRIIYISGKKDF